MTIFALTVPKWGLTMQEGTLIGWSREIGDSVVRGDELAEVESSKIAGVLEAPAAGVLRRQVAAAGDTLPVGGLLGILTDADEPDSALDLFVEGFIVEAPDEAEMGAAEPDYAAFSGQQIAYTLLGADRPGLPLVLIHGFGGDRNNWLFNQAALAADRPVLAVDLPGHGASSKAVADASLAGLAGAVLAAMDAAGLGRVLLVGHSMGGAVALALAHQQADRIAGVLTLAGAGQGVPVNLDYISSFMAAERRKEMKEVARMLFADEDKVSRDLVEDLLRFKRTDGVEAALRAIAGGALADASGDLRATLAVPHLALWGEADRIIPAPPGARTIPGTGHMLFMEAAGAVNAAVLEFADSL